MWSESQGNGVELNTLAWCELAASGHIARSGLGTRTGVRCAIRPRPSQQFRKGATSVQYLTAGCCVGRRPNRFLQVVRSRLNLSSGEKRAGCADMVGVPSGAVFCSR